MENKTSGQLVAPKSEEVVLKTEPKLHLGGPQSGFPPPYIVGQDLAPYLIVGIDFGSTFCRVATFRDGAPQAVQPHEYSAVVEDVLARNQNQKSLVYGIKTCINADYAIRANKQLYTPVDLAERMFASLKSSLEHSTERMLSKAIIAVPAAFTHRERSAVMEGAQHAEINVLGLINDTTAAALDACYTNNLRDGFFLVISNGMYSLETAIIHAQNRLLETKVVNGWQALSGQAFNLTLADAIAQKYNITDDATFDELVVAVEDAKKQLSTQPNVKIKVNGLGEIDLDRFEVLDWLSEHQKAIADQIMSAMNAGAIAPQQLAGIITTGGGAKAWWLSEVLTRLFPQVSTYNAVVSSGAAIYAALLVRQAKDWVIWDALASAVVVVEGSHIKQIIAANSPLPLSGHYTMVSRHDGTCGAKILQYVLDRDGEYVHVASVNLVEQLPPDNPTSVDLAVTMTADGVLSFTARHKSLDVNLTVETLPPPRDASHIIYLDGDEPAAEVTHADDEDPLDKPDDINENRHSE